jgi:hypothetical protein
MCSCFDAPSLSIPCTGCLCRCVRKLQLLQQRRNLAIARSSLYVYVVVCERAVNCESGCVKVVNTRSKAAAAAAETQPRYRAQQPIYVVVSVMMTISLLPSPQKWRRSYMSITRRYDTYLCLTCDCELCGRRTLVHTHKNTHLHEHYTSISHLK